MFLFLRKNKLYVKNKLKYENKIVIDNIILLMSVTNKLSKLFTDKNPPEEIMVKEKLKASKVLKFAIFKNIKIIKVKKEYKINTLKDCFKVSVLLKDKKFVSDFFKLLSKTSIKRIIEKRKYKPPIHWVDDLHKIKL